MGCSGLLFGTPVPSCGISGLAIRCIPIAAPTLQASKRPCKLTDQLVPVWLKSLRLHWLHQRLDQLARRLKCPDQCCWTPCDYLALTSVCFDFSGFPIGECRDCWGPTTALTLTSDRACQADWHALLRTDTSRLCVSLFCRQTFHTADISLQLHSCTATAEVHCVQTSHSHVVIGEHAHGLQMSTS